MKYTVVLQPRAHRQFRHFVQWLTARSPEGAERWITAFEAAVSRLEQDPESYGLASETIRSFRELRQTFFKTLRGRKYRIVFVVVDVEVRVLAIRAPGQRPLKRRDLG